MRGMGNSPYTGWLILLGIVLVLTLMQRRGRISVDAAREHLRKGAVVVDVRTEAEFAAGHLQGAVNIPLDRLEALAPQRLRDQKQILLLHCQSGMRSAVARKKLAAMGYASAVNLGSYGRAARILAK